MPRTARQVSRSGWYHVIARGNGRQLLFEDDADRERFCRLMVEHLEDAEVSLGAWCLMSNHVHLLVEDPQQRLSQAMHGLETAYALRFNARTGHVGAVFQGRFKSIPIESDRQLLAVVRYIHENPERAGVARADSYRWSSFHEYAGSFELCDAPALRDLMEEYGGFAALCADERFEGYVERSNGRIADEDALVAARAALTGGDPAKLKELAVARRNEGLQQLRSFGLTVKQIERLTGIGRAVIARETRGVTRRGDRLE